MPLRAARLSVVAELATARDAVDELRDGMTTTDRCLEALHVGGVLVAECVPVSADVSHPVRMGRAVGEGDNGYDVGCHAHS